MTVIISTLFPPKLSLRPRSLSNVSICSSRSPTPSASPPSTPPSSERSPRSSSEFRQHPLLELITFDAFLDCLDAPTLLALSSLSAARACRDLRSTRTYLRHLDAHGWDTPALVRRAALPTTSKARPWMFLARSALGRAALAPGYPTLPKEGDKPSLQQPHKKAAQKFFRTVVDIATEHEARNYTTLAATASAHNLTLIRFVTNIRAPDWKTRYRKTFFIAALVNWQPRQPDVDADLEALAETLNFDEPRPSPLLTATRANFLYTYGCTAPSIAAAAPPPHTPLPSHTYDPPHLSAGSSGTTPLPGVRAAVDRLRAPTALAGFYRRSAGGGKVLALRIAFEPRSLPCASVLPFSFADKDRLSLAATMHESDADKPWPSDGAFSLKAGVGKFRNASGEIAYEMWMTPWGLVGEKIRRGGGAHLGYFVLHWT